MAESTAWNEPGEDDPARLQAQQIAGHIRRRPGMYIGDIGSTGLHSLAYELVEYGLAEIASGHGQSIHVQINGDGSLSVADDGQGIPVELHAKAKMTTLEWVMTLSTGVEVHGAERVFRTSVHGMGARAVTALSDWADATVCCDGRVYRQRYEQGLPSGDVCDTGPAGTRTGTQITFHPDSEIFRDASFDRDRLEARLRELAFLNKGLHITLTDARSGKEETFKYDGGIAEYVQHKNSDETVLHPVIYMDKTLDNVRVEVALQYNTSEVERVYCYANNAYNSMGGTHLTGLRKALTQTLKDYGSKENLFKNDLKPIGEDFREGLTAVVSVQVPGPQFESNNKLRLNNPEVVGVVAGVIQKGLAAWLEENPEDARRIILKAVAAAKFRRDRIP